MEQEKIFTGDHSILQEIISFILSKNWEINGNIVHIGNNNYEIDFIKEPSIFLAGCGYKGKFWVENGKIKHKEQVTWMA